VLSLADISPTIKNIQDMLFLTGYHSPTIALLYSPMHTWAGRYGSARDTYRLEIRTFDSAANGSFPLLTSATNLPSDSLYLVACPPELPGVVLITTTGIVHIGDAGRIAASGVNAWWDYTTSLKADRSSEHRKLALEGSKCVFVGASDMLLVLQNGDVHQVRFEMEGRSVSRIVIEAQTDSVPPPAALILAGELSLFVASIEGDSLLAKVELVRESVGVAEDKPLQRMEVDYDEDGEFSCGILTDWQTCTAML
jgi:cleavage and polyadenylation specificity factor subunit 1